MHRLTRRALTQRLGIVTGGLIANPVLAGALATPEQTEGPFYPVTPQPDKDIDLTQIDGHGQQATGETILVRGRVMNTNGEHLSGAVVDIWQANHYGRYSHPDDPNTAPLDEHFQGWGVTSTDADGRYGFRTILPGAYPLGPGASAPRRCRHIHFKVSHPGHEAITTQMYFEGDPLIEDDIVLGRLRRDLWPLLIAKPSADPESGHPLHRFDIVLA